MARPATAQHQGGNQSSRRRRNNQYQCKATQLTPAWNLLSNGETVAMDIEFQQYKHEKWTKQRHRVGRVAIVNTKGETILDVCAAYPNEEGVKKFMPPKKFGVSWPDFSFDNGAVIAWKVERWVKQIIQNRTVVLHGGKHDQAAFVIESDVFGKSTIVDTQEKYEHLQYDGTPSLRFCAAEILGVSIQETEHNPVEDANTTMKLYLAADDAEFDENGVSRMQLDYERMFDEAAPE